jgi:hypothetical protein
MHSNRKYQEKEDHAQRLKLVDIHFVDELSLVQFGEAYTK